MPLLDGWQEMKMKMRVERKGGTTWNKGPLLDSIQEMLRFMVIALNPLATRAPWNYTIFILLLLLVLKRHKTLVDWQVCHILLNEKKALKLIH